MKLAHLGRLLVLVACTSARELSAAPRVGSDPAPTCAFEARDARQANAGAPPAFTPRVESQSPTVDFNRERALIEESEAARKASDYTTARAKATEALSALLARPEGERNADWLVLLDSAGAAAWHGQDVGTAKAAWLEVLDVCARTLPPDHPNLAAARGNVALTLRTLGDLPGARALEEQVLEVCARTLPSDHPDLAAARLNLASTLGTLGDVSGARALQEQVLEVRTRTLPADHPDLAAARQNLAITLRMLGDVSGARALQEQVLEVRARTLPSDHPALATARLNLANTLFSLGDLDVARALLEKVLDVLARTLPPDHPDLATARGNLATMLRTLGDLAGARALEEEVLQVRTRTLPSDNPALAAARGNLAMTLGSLGDLAGARALEEQVLEVRERALPPDHPDLSAARGNLALTLHALGDHAGARELQEQVLEVRARTLAPDHPDVAAARGNLALTLRTLGDLALARALQEQVLEARARTLPPDHPAVAGARGNLAWTLGEQQWRATRSELDDEKEKDDLRGRCTSLLLELCQSQTSAACQALLTGSSREAEERCARLAKFLDAALTFAAGYGALAPILELDRAALVFSEATRAAAIGSALLQRAGRNAPRYAELRKALKQASDELSTLAQQGASSAQIQGALNSRDALERDLVSLARSSSGEAAAVLEFDVEELAARLGAGAAAISFRSFTRFNLREPDELDATGEPKLEQTSVASLCALVVRGAQKSDDPAQRHASVTRIDLGPIAAIETAVNAWRKVIGTETDRGLAVGVDRTTAMRASGEELRRSVFDPLLPALEGVERVVVALDDVLHLVPLEALPLDETEEAAGSAQLVGERWRIETRCTLTELLAPSLRRTDAGVLVALGGASFQSQPLAPDAEDLAVVNATEPERVELAGLLRGGAWERGFTPLTYTGLEAREIAALRAEVTENDDAALVLEKRKASRASLEQLAPKARWLHVATHGWFAPESVRSWSDVEPLDKQSGLGLRQSGEEQIRGMSPMLLCGLALAGANLPLDVVGRAPGLITAEEIAALDLSQCELAVLSACDTNVGERRAGQGVASLQRALQMAGARSVITSLWKVPDEATRELMVDFYRRIWSEKKPKHQALWEAKMRIRDAKDEAGSPKYTVRDWAAWVLTGAQD